jgi:uncharacterized damage-inducible protein DinB
MSAIEVLLRQIDQAFDRASWHGPNLMGSLRGMDAAEASQRPSAQRHNIWELTLHCAYWKYAAWRRITGQKRGSFPLKGSNFFARPVPEHSSSEQASQWKQDLLLLSSMHRQLREAVAGLAPEALFSKVGQRPRIDLITGIAAHDLYHAGQIQLLKRMLR